MNYSGMKKSDLLEELDKLTSLCMDLKSKLQKTREDLKKQEEIDSMKDEFVSTVTHELRTPMTPLKSTIDLMLDGALGKVNPQQKKYLEMMSRNIERLIQFTTEVLTLSKLESGTYKLSPREVKLLEVIKPTIDLMKEKARKHDSKITLDVKPEITAYADPDSLGMVITNLTNNAIVHNNPGTTIKIQAEKSKRKTTSILVIDNGCGLPHEYIENIFDRFYQLGNRKESNYKGTGIGLAVCKALVGAMGGELSVESAVDKGTTFRFSIPSKKQ